MVPQSQVSEHGNYFSASCRLKIFFENTIGRDAPKYSARMKHHKTTSVRNLKMLYF